MAKRRRPSKVMRLWDWSVPPTGVHREVLSIVPEGWHDQPRATRKPPILFVHGMACDHTDWRAQIPVFSKTNRVLAVDLRGHGLSTNPTGEFHVTEMADDIAWFCRELGLDRRRCDRLQQRVEDDAGRRAGVAHRRARRGQ